MAQRTLIEILLPELRAYATAICQSRDAAEDLVQDAVERGLRSDRRPELLEVASRFSSEARLVPDQGEAGDTVVDEEVFTDLCAALSAEKLSETIEKVTLEFEEGSRELCRLAGESAFTEVAALAHRLAGSAAIIGGRSVQEHLVTIQNAGKDGDRDALIDALSSLDEKVGELTQVLHEFLSE